MLEVRELQQENEGSLRKLQATAEQFEWLCQQQRGWMCCVKRYGVFSVHHAQHRYGSPNKLATLQRCWLTIWFWSLDHFHTDQRDNC